jgi:hypothetical protein
MLVASILKLDPRHSPRLLHTDLAIQDFLLVRGILQSFAFDPSHSYDPCPSGPLEGLSRESPSIWHARRVGACTF